MVFKLVRTDSVEPCKIMLEVGKHLIGRGKFLDCDDKRVSRNHGELEVTEDTVIIRALHQNPCFVIKKSTKETEILKQNCTLNISNGDRFGLLPNSYWYELLHCTVSDVAQPTKPLSTMTEGDIELDSVETEPFETENADVSQEIKFNFDETVTNDNPESPSLIAPEEVDLGIETIVTTGIDQNNRSESEEQTLIKRAHSSEDIKDPSIVKKIKTTPEQNKTEEGVQIKQEPVDNEDLKNPKAGPSNDQGVSSASKDNAAANSPDAAAPAKPLGRERCMYGENCYSENLLVIRAEKLTQKRMTVMRPAIKKQYINRKRQAEQYINKRKPDEPLRKTRTLKPSTEREPCGFLPGTGAPLPSSGDEVFEDPWLPSTSSAGEGFIVPDLVDSSQNREERFFKIEPAMQEPDPSIGREVVIHAEQPSVIGINGGPSNDVVNSCELDSDSDLDNENINNDPLSTTLEIDTVTDEDLTPYQLRILQTEDRANDEVLHHLVPDDCFSFNWTRDKSTFTAKRETFTGTPGPTTEMTDTTTPTDIFHMMFDVDFIDMLCTETNRYAQQKLDSMKDKLSQTTRFSRWTPTDRQEMISLLSIFILQGLYPLPNEESYFSFNGFGTMPYFSKIMPYNRYLLLNSMLHFANNDLSIKTKLFKIQPIIDYFNKKFSSLFYPHQEVAIDESLLKWQGRLSFAQKINTIAAQVGIKTYELCDSTTGYLWQFRVYAGKDNKTVLNDNNDNIDDSNTNGQDTKREQTLTTDFTPTHATAKIVFDLLEPLLHRGHTVIMDNFYNCPLLARCLKRKRTDCYGTLRLNREFIPPSIRTMTKTDLRHGELVATYCPDLSLMVWRHANLVSMISTYHPLQIGARKKHNQTKNKPYKPSIVLDYNRYMGGVDRKDQFLSAQPMERGRSRVWYKKVFRRLFNVAVFNCYVIYHTKHTRLAHRQFRTILAEDLLKACRHIDLGTETRVITRVPRTMTATMITTTTTTATFTTTETMSSQTRRNSKFTMQNRPIVEGNHFPMRAPAKRGNCWWCSQKKVLSRTVWQCIECGVYLCIIGCFRDFHKP
ncbi:hypothetical protein evm_009175 [Chilo suppressalis]|nr:hypothetical protein evm_009175 [Chilo suppressalis]